MYWPASWTNMSLQSVRAQLIVMPGGAEVIM
jgi:hypothetical protein